MSTRLFQASPALYILQESDESYGAVRIRRFYDVPRHLVLRYRGKVILLQSAFNEEVDEYDPRYSVYLMADSIEEMANAGTWEFLAFAERQFVGEVLVENVTFDPTRRKTLDADCLEGVL